MRPLIYGTSPMVGSGYATAVRYVSQGLKARGHEPAVYGWNSHGLPKVGMGGVPIYPGGNTITGYDLLGDRVRKHQADCILALCDPWIMDEQRWRYDHNVPIFFWFPCQSEPASKPLLDICGIAEGAFCYSKWGTQVMKAGGLATARYVPLGVDCSIYQPMDRAEARAKLGDPPYGPPLGDRFLIGMVAANSSTVPVGRKAFDQAFAAFAQFKQDVPDAVFYVHTISGDTQGGYQLVPLLNALGLKINVDVMFPDPGLYTDSAYDDRAMACVYNACDIVHQATSAEGFGLPVLEAQACGRPVVTTEYSSMPELTVNGLMVPAAVKHWAPGPVDGWVASPDPHAIVEAWRWIRLNQDKTGTAKGLDLARSLSWDTVIDQYLLPAMEGHFDALPSREQAYAGAA